MMPSNRRVNAFFLVIVLVALLTIYISASARQTRSSDFYTKTQDAIDASRRAKDTKAADAEVATGEDIRIKDRLEAAATAAKAKAEEKAESYHGSEAKQKALKVAESLRDDPPQKNSHSEPSKGAKAAKEPSVKGEKSVAGRIKLKGPKETMPKVSSDVEDVDIEADKEDAEAYREETEDEQKAHAELSEILKRSPSMLFPS
jgi:FtsZ-interacting cell division protein ZipA